MGVRDTGVDFLDAVDTQHGPGGRLGELVRAVGGADGDGQGVHLGQLHEFSRFVRVGQQLVVAQRAFGAVAIFRFTVAGFQRTQTTQFAFYGHANSVGHIHHVAADVDVVLERGRGLAVGHQRAVHHHGREAGLDGLDTNRGGCAVILVHHHGDVWIHFHGGFDQVTQEGFTSVLTRTGGTLHDHGAVAFVSRFHDGLDLFQVVHVERWQTIAVLSGVVQQLTQGY